MAGRWIAARGVVLVACAALGGSRAAAQDASSLSGVQEMTSLFGAFCLRAFPDVPAVARLAAEHGARPLTPVQVRSYLHDDPGQGWHYSTPLATYAVTIEQPPYSACAIRRMTPSGFPTVKPYLAAISAFAAARGAPLVPAGQQAAKTPGGADISAYVHAIMTPGANVPTDTFIVLLTDYHGRYLGDLSRDVGTGNAGVEVRFVHQMPSPR